jgi:GT2 family glycosyltransferase
MTETRTTVVIATRNRRDFLLEALDRLERLPERPPIVVADNGSGDGTAGAVWLGHPGAHLIELGRNAGVGARNAAIAAASTPYVALCDDDSWWVPGALSRAERLLDTHPRLALIAARVLVGPDERLDPTCAEMARSELPGEDLPGPALLGFVACGAVVRRSAFLEVGGFEERFGIGGEEELLALELAQAGHQLAYVDDVVAHHHPPAGRDPSGRRRVELRNGIWVAWLRRRPMSALIRTARLLARSAGDPRAGLGAIDALRGAGWVARNRRPVPVELDRCLRSLG